MDFELTDDGDLFLGQQSVDEEGYLLYYMVDDIGDMLPMITRDANEATIPVRDFRTTQGSPQRLQLIKSRLQTENPDWSIYENVGASLSDFIGETNNPETGKKIEERVLHTLLRNEAFDTDELFVNVAPTSPKEVLVDIVLDSQEMYLRYAFSLDFEIGINNIYILDESGEVLEKEEKINPDIFEGIPEEQFFYEDMEAEEEEQLDE